jgi:Family of unknown function (DUF5995)
MTIFPYDPMLLAAVQTAPQSVADVMQTMRTIDAACVEGDGLKWFNGLYMQVTEAVKHRIAAGGFTDPVWLAELDVQFARLYFSALSAELRGTPCTGCWQAMFDVRGDTRLARIQFALAGVNAHINHDLPEALVATCQVTGTAPNRGTPQYADYTNLNATLDSLVEEAKRTLQVRLLGDPLPGASQLQNTIAAWGVKAAREKSWKTAQVLWHLKGSPDLVAGFMDSLDGLTTVVNKTLLVPVP